MGDTSQRAQAVRESKGRTAQSIWAAAAKYARAQPYTANSTLLFVLVPGAPTVSNHPEVFGGPPEIGESVSEQQSENHEASMLLMPHPGYSVERVPDVGKLRILEHQVALGATKVVVGAGEPLAVVRSAQHGVARAFI